MVNDLLHISKELLKCLNSNDNFSEDENKYVMIVVNKMLIIVAFELNKTIELCQD